MRLVQRLQPDLTIHYHQPYGIVVRSRGVDLALARRYAARTGLPLRALAAYRGTVAGWQNARRAGSALVVELAAGTVSQRTADRHAAAALAPRPGPRRARFTDAAAPRVAGSGAMARWRELIGRWEPGPGERTLPDEPLLRTTSSSCATAASSATCSTSTSTGSTASACAAAATGRSRRT